MDARDDVIFCGLARRLVWNIVHPIDCGFSVHTRTALEERSHGDPDGVQAALVHRLEGEPHALHPDGQIVVSLFRNIEC